MTLEHFLALFAFAFVAGTTPGPNNLMLMASGANFGFRRTIPHMLGVGLGFPIMVLLVGFGAMELFELWPLSLTILQVVSVAYILWLGWKIANAAAPGHGDAGATPLTFLQAALFQWVNPKGWTMSLSTITLFAQGREGAAVFWVAGTFVATSVISCTSWTLAGKQLRRWLTNPKRLRLFNWTMAGLLVASMGMVLI